MLAEREGEDERVGSKPLVLFCSGEIPGVAGVTTPVVAILGFSVGSIVPNFLTPVARTCGERIYKRRQTARCVGVRFYTNLQRHRTNALTHRFASSRLWLRALEFRRQNDVFKQHRYRHRTDPAGYRRYRRGLLFDRRIVDITGQSEPTSSRGIRNPRNADIDHYCAFLNHVRRDRVRHSRCGNQYVGTKRV